MPKIFFQADSAARNFPRDFSARMELFERIPGVGV